MEEFMETIKPLDISRLRRKQNNDKASSDEITSFLSVTGKLNFLGHGVLPVAGFVASYYQQRVSQLTVADLRELNSALTEVQNLHPILLFPVPPLSFKAKYLAFSDASQGRYSYGQNWIYFRALISNPNFASVSCLRLDQLKAKSYLLFVYWV